jgi:hypothetical protein
MFTGTVDAHYARMVHDRQGSRLPHEARAGRIGGDFRRHHLENDASPVCIAREIKHAHPSVREPALDEVGPDGGARIDANGRSRAHESRYCDGL